MRTFHSELKTLASYNDVISANDIVGLAKGAHGPEVVDRVAVKSRDESLVREVNRFRHRRGLRRLNSVPFRECEVPPAFRLSRSGQPYLIYDSKIQHPGRHYQKDALHYLISILTSELDRTLLFCSPSQLRMMAEAQVCASDPTFSGRPTGVMQKQIVLAYIPLSPGSLTLRAVHVATAYMERKTELDYRYMFTALRTQLPQRRREIVQWIGGESF